MGRLNEPSPPPPAKVNWHLGPSTYGYSLLKKWFFRLKPLHDIKIIFKSTFGDMFMDKNRLDSLGFTGVYNSS